MANSLIDEDTFGKDNEKIKKMIRLHNLTPPKFWVGDKVYCNQITKGKVIDMYGFPYWDGTADDIIENKQESHELTVTALNKHQTDTPWWYKVKINDNTFYSTAWFVEEGLYQKIPTYTPRKTQRTLEKLNTRDEAEEINILIRNVEEFDTIYEELKKHGYKIYDSFRKQVQSAKNPINIFVNLKTGEITQSTLSEYIGNWTDYSVFDGVWEKELTIDDLPLIDHILQHKTIKLPTYEPRKIKKLNEETDVPYYMPEKPPILTPERQEEMYKVGDIVIVRPDAFDYFNDIDEEEMGKFLGKKVKIVSISTKEEIYGESLENPRDLLITVVSADEDFPNRDRWYWSYRCLFHPREMKPSYKPRKMNRRLDEKTNVDFSHIPSPILTQEQQKLFFKIGDIVIIRPDAFDYFYDVNDSMKDWLGEYGEITYITIAEDIYGINPERGKEMKPDDLLLTLRLEGSPEDSDTYYWFYRCLVNPEFAIPSYKPRHIDRTIEESFREDYHINPEKYQERFGRISPPIIPIEEIEEFYDVKFESYCNDLGFNQ